MNLPYDRRHIYQLAGMPGVSNGNYEIDAQDVSLHYFDGVHGADVLLSGDVEFDFLNRKITFYKSSSCNDNTVPWTMPFEKGHLVLHGKGPNASYSLA